jgi:Trk K+ transport system NAD-binding subunit
VEREGALAGLSDHVVICNCNAKVGTIVEEIHAEEAVDIVLVVQERELWEAMPAWHPRRYESGRFHVLFGHPTDEAVLAAAGMAAARAAIILADPRQGEFADARSALVAIAIERASPRVHTVMEILLSVHRSHLRATEVNEVICLGEIAEKLLAQGCISPGVSRIFGYLLTSRQGTRSIFLPALPAPLAGRTYRDLARRAIEREAPFTVCGFVQAARGEAEGARGDVSLEGGRLSLNPPGGPEGKDALLAAGDRLVVIAPSPPHDLAAALGEAGPAEADGEAARPSPEEAP